jgi:hypothetical protein
MCRICSTRIVPLNGNVVEGKPDCASLRSGRSWGTGQTEDGSLGSGLHGETGSPTSLIMEFQHDDSLVPVTGGCIGRRNPR